MEDESDSKKVSQLVCVGTSAGQVKLIDLHRNKVLQKLEFNGACIYALDWNENGILAVGPTTAEVHVFKFSKSKINL